MPVAATNTYTFNPLQPSRHPELALMERFQMAPSLTFVRGDALAIQTSTGFLIHYIDGNADGQGTMRAICPDVAVTDGAGNISVGGGNILGTTEDTIAVYVGGYFFSKDVANIDAAGLADMGGHILWGDLTTGEFVVPV